MPRPQKCRKVCALPRCTNFSPSTIHNRTAVVMTVDEYETVRLIDLEGLTQEECAEQMGVARTTAQAIYTSARKKLAQCIVQGRQMLIAGGNVQCCEHRRNNRCRCCVRRRGAHTQEEQIFKKEVDLNENCRNL